MASVTSDETVERRKGVLGCWGADLSDASISGQPHQTAGAQSPMLPMEGRMLGHRGRVITRCVVCSRSSCSVATPKSKDGSCIGPDIATWGFPGGQAPGT